MKKEIAFFLLFSIVTNIIVAQEPVIEHNVVKKFHLRWDNTRVFESATPEKFMDWSLVKYSWDGRTISAWLLSMGTGLAHGMREAYHADPYVFEKRWGVTSESFWGSDAWKRNYINNDPDLPHKHELFGNVGRDIWHTSGFVSKTGLISASFAIGSRGGIPRKYRVANWLIGFGIHSLFATITYKTLR